MVDDADRNEIGRANVSEELRRLLFLQEPGNQDFVVRFQQTTGPVMAKGVEDTAFYRFFRLAALNEVGGTRPGSACRSPSSTRRTRNGRSASPGTC